MRTYKYHSYAGEFRAVKTLITAEYAGINVERVNITMNKDNLTEEFKKKSPTGQVPVLETPDGRFLFESGAIQRFIARLRPEANLYGDSFHHMAEVDQWLDLISTIFDNARAGWLLQVYGFFKYNEAALTQAKNDLFKLLGVFNNVFLFKTYLVCEHVTIADIALFGSLIDLYREVLAPVHADRFPNVMRWFVTLLNQPEFSKHAGSFSFATEEKQPQSGEEKSSASSSASAAAPAPASSKTSSKKESKKEEKPKESPEKSEKSKKKKEEPAAAAAAPAEGEKEVLKKKKAKESDSAKETDKPKEGDKAKEGDKDAKKAKAKSKDKAKDADAAKGTAESPAKAEAKPKKAKGDKDKAADKDKEKEPKKTKSKPKKDEEEGEEEQDIPETDKSDSHKLEDRIAAEEAAKKKERDPLDDLPPSKMNLDATKRAFYAEKPHPPPSFFPNFWANFDKAGYSLWTSEYKFNDENNVYFMTNNLINGFIQRAEECRKYAFGVLNMLGNDEDTPPFKVNGAWLFRGLGVPKKMQDCPDAENFSWNQLDLDNPAHRKRFEELFTQSLLNGETVLERKYFK